MNFGTTSSGRRIIKALTAAVGAVMMLMGAAGAPAAGADSPRVVVTLKPVHSIVAGVMRGIGEPSLLLPDGASPHAYALRPSDARLIRAADLIVWVGEEVESFLRRPLASLGARAVRIKLLKEPGVLKLKSRKGGLWRRNGKSPVGGSRTGEIDGHIWLDPANGQAIAKRVASSLAALDPQRAPRYEANAQQVAAQLSALDLQLRTALRPVAATPYIVFHDAYQYFERHFGLNAVGAITRSPERGAGAKRLRDIRKSFFALGIRCVFAEPSFAPAQVAALIRGTKVRSAFLDPVGIGVGPGPDAYAAILRAMAASLRNCLRPQG